MEAALDTGVDLLDSPVRRTIVDLLANLEPTIDRSTGEPVPHEGLSAQELGERLGLHVTTVRFHLDQLVSSGLLRTHFQRREGAGRPRKLYSVERGSLATVAPERSYRMLSELLVESFRTDAEGRVLSPEEAGALWATKRVREERIDLTSQQPARTPGQWLGKIGQMVDLLRDWGYTPEVSTTNGGRTARVALHECPFMAMARENTPVVCGIHRGLMRGALESLGEESPDVGLTPFVTPNLCVASITAATPFEHVSRPDKEIRS